MNTLFSLIIFFLYLFVGGSFGQSPAEAPGPPPPMNISRILEKGGQFSILIRLLKSTQVANQINTQLNDSNSELTIFAPTDNAFSNLQSGTLNSLNDQEKVELLQFHMIPTFLSLSNFQTVSNPVRTQAGDAYEFPLNVTTSGNSVNVSSGLTNTSISGTVYSDNQLAVYQIDSVLKPIGVFQPRPPPPAPAPEKSKKKAKAISEDPKDSTDDNSSAVPLTGMPVFFTGAAAVAGIMLVWINT
ncbi:fasciclin-like arabinogalactan protein 12 [Cucurbita maxima]|uniref:Fasciclin-like arabinogalactan protein 12 n=1 Tax=Cucurbita maxima TaxID=3661 RepID=A0A6J1HZ28_CUCMA|nr:fasciclin-like arabinogalactan protein 12 [Cucurbita maxima]